MARKPSQPLGANVWLVDSGCTSHMTGDVSMFTSLDRSYKVEIKLGNGDLVQSEGKDTFNIHTREGTKLISSVLYVPYQGQNLLSVAKMLKKGYSLNFKDSM